MKDRATCRCCADDPVENLNVNATVAAGQMRRWTEMRGNAKRGMSDRCNDSRYANITFELHWRLPRLLRADTSGRRAC